MTKYQIAYLTNDNDPNFKVKLKRPIKEESVMTYREMAVEVTKIAGQELIDRAEELICDTDGVKDIDIWIRIPSLTDDPYIIPEIQISTNVYPKRRSIDNIMDLMNKGGRTQ